MVWNKKFIKYRENKFIATKYVQHVRQWHEHKHASVFAIGHHSRFHSTRYVATKLTRPQCGGLDYAIWSVIQQREYETRVHDIYEMRQRLLHVWRSLEQSLIDDAVDQRRTHLRAYVRASGDVSYSLGSVSTLFRWGGHFCHICAKHIFLFTTVQ